VFWVATAAVSDAAPLEAAGAVAAGSGGDANGASLRQWGTAGVRGGAGRRRCGAWPWCSATSMVLDPQRKPTFRLYKRVKMLVVKW
jgi:hypothetical protein